MKKFIILTSLLLTGLINFGQSASVGLSPINVTSNSRGGVINKGDTVIVTLKYTNNSSTIRTFYFDFQHQITALSLLDIQFPTGGAQGSALPSGTQTSFTNNYYPGYYWNDNSNNNTTDGLVNAQNANYSYNANSQKAINRITINTATPSNTNLGNGDLAYLRFKVEQVGAGYAYDSIYMNFVYGWPTNGAQQTVLMPRATASSWVDVAATSNALINGILNVNTLLGGTYQPNVRVTDTQNLAVTNFMTSSSGVFTAAQQLQINKPYNFGAYVPADSLPSILNKAITISDYTLALTEWNKQNLDGTFTFQTLSSGIAYLAADINGNGKFDGQDLALIFAQAVGYDTTVVAPQGSTIYNLPTFLASTYDTLTYSGWKGLSSIPTSVPFSTTNVAQSLSLKYVIPGDINRSHSSQRTTQGNNQTYGAYLGGTIKTNSLSTNQSYINSENQNLQFIDVNLTNVTVTSNNIEIPITVDNKGLAVTAVQFEFVYDPTKVKFEELKSNFPNTWAIFVNSKEDARIKFVAIDKDLKNPLTGTVPFSLKFSSIGSGVDISTKVQVTQNMDASDNKGVQLGINLNTSTIKLTGYNKFN